MTTSDKGAIAASDFADSPGGAETGTATTTAISDSTVLKFIEVLGNKLTSGDLGMQSFPEVVVRIREVVSAPDSSIDEVTQVANTDPVFTAQLINMANSVLARRGDEPVVEVRLAIARLGFDMVRNTAVAMATKQIMSAKAHGVLKPQLKELWKHSVKVAALANVMAKELTSLNPDEALLAGLLHDIGKFYILVHAKQHPEIVEDKECFDEIVYDWHTSIGRAILEEWGFPEAFALAADEHEVLDRDHNQPPDLCDVVTVANLCVNLRESDPEAMATINDIAAVKRLKLDHDKTVAFMEASDQQLRGIRQALQG